MGSTVVSPEMVKRTHDILIQLQGYSWVFIALNSIFAAIITGSVIGLYTDKKNDRKLQNRFNEDGSIKVKRGIKGSNIVTFIIILGFIDIIWYAIYYLA